MTKPTLLLVDDERSAREGLERLLRRGMRYCVPPLERRRWRSCRLDRWICLSATCVCRVWMA